MHWGGSNLQQLGSERGDRFPDPQVPFGPHSKGFWIVILVVFEGCQDVVFMKIPFAGIILGV